MDENQTNAKDILRKRILDEKLDTTQSDDNGHLMSEPDSVFQTFSGNSMSEGASLFSSREDSNPDFDVKDSSENSLFSSEATSLQPDKLFSTNHEEETENIPQANDTFVSDHSPFSSEISSDKDLQDKPSTASNLSDNPLPDEEDMSDSAFPLFLSFKANDSIQNVSEGVREKYTDHMGNDKRSLADSPVQSDVGYSDSGIPIFKPYTLPEENDESPVMNPTHPQNEEASYDIPNVFSKKQSKRSSQADSENDLQVSNTKSRLERASAVTASSAGSTSQYSASSESMNLTGEPSALSSTVRPGARYSPAQQMGNTAPLSPREIKGKKVKKSREHRPLLLLILLIVILIAVFSLWPTFGSGNLFSGLLHFQSGTTIEQSVHASEISSEITLAATETTIAVTSTPTTMETTTAASTSAETTAATTTAATTTAATTTAATTTAATENLAPAMIPSGFSTSIEDGKSNDDSASFSILFKNTGAHDVSLYDGVEYITVAFSTNNIKITQVTSPDFTFTADPKKTNFFIGTPISTDIIAKKDTKTVVVSAKSDGTEIGNYTIKYFVNCYK